VRGQGHGVSICPDQVIISRLHRRNILKVVVLVN